MWVTSLSSNEAILEVMIGYVRLDFTCVGVFEEFVDISEAIGESSASGIVRSDGTVESLRREGGYE